MLQRTYLRLSTVLPNQTIYNFICYPIKTSVKGKTVAITALLDCGASELFINTKTVKKLGIPTIKLIKPKKVFNADGTENKEGSVTHVVNLPIIIDQHEKIETVWVTNIGEEDFIIGLTWLRKWNPSINWITGKMTTPMKIRAKLTKSQEISQQVFEQQKEEKFEDKFPETFNEFKPLFDEVKSHRMPESRPYDHKIELKPDWKPFDAKVYPLPPVED